MKWRVILEHDTELGDWAVWCPELPGCTSAGKTEEEALELIDSIKPIDPISIRNRAIIELFYACGLRTTELCELQTIDLNLKEQLVTIKGKGNKIRTVPIGQYCCYYIELYLEKSRKYMLRGRKDDPGNLFLSYRGRPFDKSTINKTVLRKVLKKLNFKKHLSFYSFRHSIASHCAPVVGAL